MAELIKINPDLDFKALNRILQEKSRLQVANFFTPDSAEYLYRLLMENKDWYLAYNERDNYFESSMDQISALNPEQRHKFMNNIYVRAGSFFIFA
jgi:hypothetical protein